MRGAMYFRYLVLGLLQALIWSFPLCAQSEQAEDCYEVAPPDPQSAQVVIDSLEFQENGVLTPEVQTRLVGQLKRRHYHASSPLDVDWQNEVRDEIQVALQEQGYFRAVVDLASGLIRAEPHRLHYWISVRTKSGPQYHLGVVRFEGAPRFSEGELRAQVTMQEGELFSVPKVREATKNFRRLYSKLGYIDFTAEPKTDIDENAHRIDLTFRLELGAQYRVGALAIHGFDAATEKLLESKFEIGQVFDETAADEFLKGNRAPLRSGTHVENGLTVGRDAQSGTVSIAFEHRVCAWPPIQRSAN